MDRAWETLGAHRGLRTSVGLGQKNVPEPRPDAGTLYAYVARYYRGIAWATDAMGREWAFPVLRVLQLFQSASDKVPTAWEKSLGGPAIWARCVTVMEREMAAEPDFVSLTSMCDAETSRVFVDQNAHVTETANRQIAERITDILMPLLTGRGVGEASPPR